jgi:glutathionylspermidine synthase
MERVLSEPRPDWQSIVEGQGLFFHTAEGIQYWDEHVFYDFSAAQIDVIEQATNDLNEKCLETVQYLVDKRDETFPKFGIPEEFWDFVCESWDEDEHTLYGRFDFAYDGVAAPKLLEYNADTPTSLLEAAVIQYYWLQDMFPRHDQFNNIHERLIEAFERIRNDRELGPNESQGASGAVLSDWQKSCTPKAGTPFYLTSLSQDDSVEDYMTATYLRDLATQAGLDARYLPIESIGFGDDSPFFRDGGDEIAHIFKLYPWEWLVREEFGRNLLNSKTEWYEPAWKMLLSNKAILPYLYDLFGDSPYILKSSFDQNDFGDTWVRKPIFSREGQNIMIVKNGQMIADTRGEYGEFPVIYQDYTPLPIFAGNTPVVGSWMVNGYACGIGIRETEGMVTNNTSRFVPHRFTPAAVKGSFGSIRKKLLGK